MEQPHAPTASTGPRVVVVGHLTHAANTLFGVPQEGWGGTGPIAALALTQLGEPALLVTRMSRRPRDREYGDELRDAGVQIIFQWAKATMSVRRTFPDLRNPDFSHEKIMRRCEPYDRADVGKVFARNPQVAVLAPLGPDDMPPEVIADAAATGARVYLHPRGMLRRHSRRGHVYPEPWADAGDVLSQVSVLVLNHAEALTLLGAHGLPADRAAQDIVDRYACGAVYVTCGMRGSVVSTRGTQPAFIPAYLPTETVINPAGCGGVYLAGVVYAGLTGKDPVEAGQFAGMCAGINAARARTGVSPAADVEELLREARAGGGPEAKAAGGGAAWRRPRHHFGGLRQVDIPSGNTADVSVRRLD